jgi:hypothetical protein
VQVFELGIDFVSEIENCKKTKMKKLIVALFLGLYLFNPINVSSQEYEDLLVLLVDEKYEKCFDKALKYTESDKTKNDPMPYLYAAQALHAMSKDHKYSEIFPKAYTDALSFAKNYRKKDKTYSYREDAEPFLEKLKLEILEEIDNYNLIADEKSYKKSLGLMKKIVTIDPDCYGSELLRGELEIVTKNKSEGRKFVAAAFDNIKKIGVDIQFADLTLSQQKYLKYALIFSAQNMMELDRSKAKEIISIGQPYFGEANEGCLIEDNDDFKTVYKKITG